MPPRLQYCKPACSPQKGHLRRPFMPVPFSCSRRLQRQCKRCCSILLPPVLRRCNRSSLVRRKYRTLHTQSKIFSCNYSLSSSKLCRRNVGKVKCVLCPSVCRRPFLFLCPVSAHIICMVTCVVCFPADPFCKAACFPA